MNQWANTLQRIEQAYFSDSSRWRVLQPGEVLLEQNAFNDRLYYVICGSLTGTVLATDEVGEDEQAELFHASAGTFIGVHSFFSYSMVSSSRVTANTRAELAWIDLRTPAVEPAEYGTLSEQFMPIIVQELSRRQHRMSELARERESTLKRLHLAEKMSTLGQLSAGLAHELNNAVGVMARSADHLGEALNHLVHKHHPELQHWFTQGASLGQNINSEQVRRRARELARHYGLDYEQAKRLARALEGEDYPRLPADIDQALSLWEAGRDCYDMQLAARHASEIVRSVKQLGGGDYQRHPGLNINETLREALALLQSHLREVQVELDLSELPLLTGNRTEFVQIWVNILKNGFDAMKSAQTRHPQITITTVTGSHSISVRLSNNGPMIPLVLQERIFQPNFTTKKGGQSIGLGLGLYIVKRLVESYGGVLLVESDEQETAFTLRFPLMPEPLLTSFIPEATPFYQGSD